MAHPFNLVVIAAFFFAGSAKAAYTNLPPPPGFAGAPGAWTFAPSSADDVIGKIMRQSKSLPVPGTTATMPAAYKLASNAGRVGAAVIFNHPYVRVAMGISSALSLAKVIFDEGTNQWQLVTETIEPGGIQYRITTVKEMPWVSSKSAACSAFIAERNATLGPASYSFTSYSSDPYCAYSIGLPNNQTVMESANYETRTTVCPPGTLQTPDGCKGGTVTPISEPDFVERVAPTLDPDTTWPKELPKGTPLPIELPIINPAPGENPQHRPLFVPTGDPVPNPQYDPNTAPGPNNQPWLQPGVRVNPSPTQSEPFRVDLQPLNRPVPGPEPMPGPEPITDPDSPDKPKPDEQQSLCEKHPDILACEKLKLGEVEPKDVSDEKKELAINKDEGWGQENGTCPAPRTVQLQGFSLEMPFTLLCDFASGIRPVVIGLAWLAAAFTFMGIGRRS